MRPSGRRILLQRPIWPVKVILIDIFAQDRLQVPFADYEHPVQDSRRALPTQRPAIVFARGARTGVLMIRALAAVNTAPDGELSGTWLANHHRVRPAAETAGQATRSSIRAAQVW
jgi:hypothetical protein